MRYVMWVQWKEGWVARASWRTREQAQYNADAVTSVPCEIRRRPGSDRLSQKLIWRNGVETS